MRCEISSLRNSSQSTGLIREGASIGAFSSLSMDMGYLVRRRTFIWARKSFVVQDERMNLMEMLGIRIQNGLVDYVVLTNSLIGTSALDL